MKSIFLRSVLVLFPVAGFAADPAKAPAKGNVEESSKFVFRLTPKSFQKNPELNFNILTDVTVEGKKRAEPTAEAPQYFVIEGGKKRESGDASHGGPAPTAEAVREWVLKGLAKRNYLVAKEGAGAPRPTLVVLYHWGTHESPAFDGDEGSGETPVSVASDAGDIMLKVLGDDRKRKLLVDRALLVGGMKFAVELNNTMNEEAAFRRANDTATRTAETMGLSSLVVQGNLSPFYRFTERDAKTRRLVEESFSGLYYVIVSAFDYDSVALKKPVLLWRTSMSTNSSGVSLVDTTQPLIATGADFIGRETDGGIFVSRKINRQGTVKIGEGEVIDYVEEVPGDKSKKK